MNYTQLNNMLTGRCQQHKKLGNNTHAIRRADSIAIRLHSTDILTFFPDGKIIATSGGWKTVTTKDRLNQYLPFTLSQRGGRWFFGDNGSIREFADGLTIHADGSITGTATPTDIERAKDLNKRISAYCKALVAALPLPMPGAGDCWFCYFREEKTGLPLGEVTKNTDHLESHLEDNYFVPSLVWRALEFCGCHPQGGGCAWFEVAFGKLNIGSKDQIGSMVKKYLRRQFGLA